MNHLKSSLLEFGRDPDPIEIVNEHAKSDTLLVCEHAGIEIPARLNQLGLGKNEFGMHIARDIGAEPVARRLAQLLDCTLILQRYSRLVIDCNRPPGSPQSIPEISDGVSVPGNQALTQADIDQRRTRIFEPFADACRTAIARPDLQYAFSVHSFTPEMNGESRPWDVGLLYRDAISRGDQLMSLSRLMWSDLNIGENEPYNISDSGDWFIPVCVEPRGLAHCLFEIRNDHLRSMADCEAWADRLFDLITTFRKKLNDAHP